jgi:hypothetical protein
MGMAVFINHNSFLIILLTIWGLMTVYLIRKASRRRRLPTLVVITLALAALYISLSPRDSSGRESTDILARIGTGTPVLLEFKSPN